MTSNLLAEADLLAAVEAARMLVRTRHNLTERQAEMLESLSGTNGAACNFAGSSHSVYEALARKGLVSFNTNARPQHRAYRVTGAGYDVLKPILDARRTLRNAREAARVAETKAADEARARASLMLDGQSYATSDEIENAVRRELGLDKLLGLK